MLTRAFRLSSRHPRRVLALAVLLMAVCGVLGSAVQSHMLAGGLVTPELESAHASDYLQQHFPGSNPNLVVFIHTDNDQGVDSPPATAVAQEVSGWLAQRPDVSGMRSYWSVTRPDQQLSLRSQDGHTALMLVTVRGDETAAQKSAGEIATGLAALSREGVRVRAGGWTVAEYDINQQVTKDLALAEGVAMPISFIVLVFVFGSVAAASLPVALGLFSIVTTLGILRLFTMFTDVSIFSLNMATALGLALAIDYSLFIVSRYREELTTASTAHDALRQAMQSAGRTVLFSAMPVALSMAAMMIFPQYFLRSFAYAGIAVVIAAAASALLVLPAIIVLLGDRINALDVRALVRRIARQSTPRTTDSEATTWYRLVSFVMRHAVPVALVTTVILIVVGTPVLSLRFGYPDDRALSTSSGASSREVGDQLRRDFGPSVGADTVAVLPSYTGPAESISGYATALSRLPHVTAVEASTGTYVDGNRRFDGSPDMVSEAGTYLTIHSDVDPSSRDGQNLLRDARQVPAPANTLFGGSAAMNADSLAEIVHWIPAALALIVAVTLFVLFLFTGSVVIPIKAILLNVLSLSASFGAIVWIFQDGHLSKFLDFTPTGYIANVALPILMFCVAFGVSMDYEVFLLSRIREEWLSSAQDHAANTKSVALGVARTGRIFTAAALLMTIIFIALATSKVSVIQMFGIGMALAVIVDATIIRTLLAPALMRLMSTANWWLPTPLAALHRRFGLAEHSPVDQKPRQLTQLEH